MNVLIVRNCLFMLKKKDKSARKLFVTGILKLFKQKQGTSFVCMTKNCKFCILLTCITLRLTPKWLIIRNATIKAFHTIK